MLFLESLVRLYWGQTYKLTLCGRLDHTVNYDGLVPCRSRRMGVCTVLRLYYWLPCLKIRSCLSNCHIRSCWDRMIRPVSWNILNQALGVCNKIRVYEACIVFDMTGKDDPQIQYLTLECTKVEAWLQNKTGDPEDLWQAPVVPSEPIHSEPYTNALV